MSVKSKEDVLELARSVIQQEMDALCNLKASINDTFYEAVTTIYQSRGKVIITGMGKSAIIGQKMVATLNSTGTTSVFMHAADAAHGDLGVIDKEDVVIILSKSGETEEIKALIPMIRSIEVPTIAVVGVKASFLDRKADISLHIPTQEEADPHNLAPTSSTTSQLALGDALAIALLDYRGFTREQFATLHPGGNLGKKLLLKVSDLSSHNELPWISIDAPLNDIIVEMTSKRLGVAAVTDSELKILGIITDGDLRRMLNKNPNPETVTAGQIMSIHPKSIQSDEKAIKALEVMRQHSISQLLVTDQQGKYCGVLHIHDLIREGLI
jgi:arabinose-5-phosphate isomerase